MVTFCQRLIQTPSLSGEEAGVATLVQAEMKRLGYDEVWSDEVGNVIGRMRGADGPSILFNAHMDQVDVGNPSEWPHPPFGGEIIHGAIWGRGASDTKGAIATQIHAIGRAREMGISFKGDVFVACVVHEETGSWGSKHLVKHLKADAAILGEATANQIAIGHRGRTEIIVTMEGEAKHASTAKPAENVLYALASLLERLRDLPLKADPRLGPEALTPTRCYTDHQSGNMTPGMAILHLDWRSLPGDDPEDLLQSMRDILAQVCTLDMNYRAELLAKEVRSYTGLTTTLPATAPAYLLDENHPLPRLAREILEERLGRSVEIKPWGFATDGGYLTQAGIPTIGFAPGDERHAHTFHDQVHIEQMNEAFWGYLALVSELPKRMMTDALWLSADRATGKPWKM